MDDGTDIRSGAHIFASVSRMHASRHGAGHGHGSAITSATQILVRPQPAKPNPLTGYIYNRHPTPGQPKFVIVDEVRFTALILLVVGALCAGGFLLADVLMHGITLRNLSDSHSHAIAVLVGGIFALLACILSAVQVRNHWKHWTHPPSQKLVVRILYMVPIYAASALGSLTFLNLSSYIDFARGIYEAFVIYTFMILLTKYLGGHNGVVEWMKHKPPQRWPFPLGFLKPVKPDSRYLYYLKYGALQYTILTPITSLAAVVLTSFGAFEDGVIEVDNGYPYIVFLVNCSQLISLYCLIWLYVCLKNELAPFQPLYKFMVVKAVVFLTFWQGVALAVMARFGWLHNTPNFSIGEVQVGMQDFLVCIEMFLAACMHKYTFGWEAYADGSLRTIMEQRALYLAEQSYRRAVEAQIAAAKAAAGHASSTVPSEDGSGSASAAASVSSEDATSAVAESDDSVEEIHARSAAIQALVRQNLATADTDGNVLFDEDLVQDWTKGSLPDMRLTPFTTITDMDMLTVDWVDGTGMGASGLGSAPGMLMTRGRVTSAYDSLYAYELDRQKPEGIDDSIDAATLKRKSGATSSAAASASSMQQNVPLNDEGLNFGSMEGELQFDDHDVAMEPEAQLRQETPDSDTSIPAAGPHYHHHHHHSIDPEYGDSTYDATVSEFDDSASSIASQASATSASAYPPSGYDEEEVFESEAEAQFYRQQFQSHQPREHYQQSYVHSQHDYQDPPHSQSYSQHRQQAEFTHNPRHSSSSSIHHPSHHRAPSVATSQSSFNMDLDEDDADEPNPFDDPNPDFQQAHMHAVRLSPPPSHASHQHQQRPPQSHQTQQRLSQRSLRSGD